MKKIFQEMRESAQFYYELFAEGFKEQTWFRLYFLAIAFVGLAYLLWSHGHYFEARLGITLTLVEIPIIVFGAVVANFILRESQAKRDHAREIGEEIGKHLEKVQKKDDSDSNKENHTKELNRKIFRRLATINMREDQHHNYGLYVKKSMIQDNPRFANIIYAPSDETVLPLDKLPSVYYEWALKHLENEEYSDKILKPFNQLRLWINKYNEMESEYRTKLEQRIETDLNRSFNGCTIYPRTIRKRIENEVWNENKIDRFSNLIIDKISRHDAIMPKGFPTEHPYIICETITENQLTQFKTILNEIMISEEFIHTNEEQNKLLFKNIEPTLKELGSQLQRLSMELEASGSILQGKCKICSSFS